MVLSIGILFGILAVLTTPGLVAQSLEERRAKRLEKEGA